MLQRYLRSLRELEEEQRLITSQILGGNSITSAPDALSAVSLELGQVRQDLAALKAWVKNLQWDEEAVLCSLNAVVDKLADIRRTPLQGKHDKETQTQGAGWAEAAVRYLCDELRQEYELSRHSAEGAECPAADGPPGGVPVYDMLVYSSTYEDIKRAVADAWQQHELAELRDRALVEEAQLGQLRLFTDEAIAHIGDLREYASMIGEDAAAAAADSAHLGALLAGSADHVARLRARLKDCHERNERLTAQNEQLQQHLAALAAQGPQGQPQSGRPDSTGLAGQLAFKDRQIAHLQRHIIALLGGPAGAKAEREGGGGHSASTTHHSASSY